MTHEEASAIPDQHTLRAQIEAGGECTDLDDAVLGIQAILGVREGGPASIHFSDLHDGEWGQMLPVERRVRLRDYAVMETRFSLMENE